MAKLTLAFKGRTIDVFHLDAESTIIGRDADCDIVVDSLAIAPIHGQIVLEQDTCHVIALAPEKPILLNHIPVIESELAHGDVLQMGKHTFSFAENAVDLGIARELPKPEERVAKVAAEPTSDQHSTVMNGCIQILNGAHLGRIIPLNRSLIRLGKSGGECAVIAFRDNGYYLSYLEGPTPPCVNGSPIGEKSCPLSSGNVIQIGNTEMQFYIGMS